MYSISNATLEDKLVLFLVLFGFVYALQIWFNLIVPYIEAQLFMQSLETYTVQEMGNFCLAP